MERNVFNGLLKDLMNHLYDYAAVETHPLAAMIEMPDGYRSSRGEFLQQLVFEGMAHPRAY